MHFRLPEIGSPRQLLRVGFALGCLLSGWIAVAQEARPEAAQSLLVGLIVDGREALVVEAGYDGAEFEIPLDAFAEICRCRIETVADGGREVSTSLGSAVVLPSELATVDGVERIGEGLLAERLAVRLTYDPGRVALILDLPWRSPPGDASRPAAPDPDIRAPATTLSSSIFRLQHSRQRGLSATAGTMTLGGRVAGGVWRTRYEEGFAGVGRALTEYAWARRFDSVLALAGHQRVSLHPLLGGLELTGVQAAWTNRPGELFATSGGPTELVPRQLRTARTITGIGIPAGTAVLRVDDRTVAAQVMDLAGRYEFRDVPFSNAGSQRVEVLIYRRHESSVPVDIHDHSGASASLLPVGAFVSQAGVGRAGNPMGTGPGGGAAGFFQGRYGVTSGLTVEGAVQRSRGRTRLLLGGQARLGAGLEAQFAGSVADGRGAYLADVGGSWGDWRLTARSQMRQGGFDGPGSTHRELHWLELSRGFSRGRWEVGFVAQRRRGLGRDVDSLLPTLSWRPDARLAFRARPDSYGRYRLDGSWRPAFDWRLGISRSDGETTADLSWRASDSLRLSVLGQRSDSGSHWQAVTATWTGEGSLSPSVAGGPLLSGGRPGARLSAQIVPVPGLLLGVRYENAVAPGRADGARDQRVALVLSGGLAFAGSRVLPGGVHSLRGGTGGIGGRIRVPEGVDLSGEVLEGVPIRVDGRAVTRTEQGGRYHVANLSPGVHRVDLDPGRLPVELTPREGRLVVEVERGAVTRADLWLDVEYGVAGRVVAVGEPVADVEVELVATDGDVVARGETDRYGLYRLDRVPPGEYVLRPVSGALDPTGRTANRLVRVVDDFLFGQDLTLAAPPSGSVDRASSVPDGVMTGSGRADVVVIGSVAGPELVSAAPEAAAALPLGRHVREYVTVRIPAPPSRPRAREHVIVHARTPLPELVAAGMPIRRAPGIGSATFASAGSAALSSRPCSLASSPSFFWASRSWQPPLRRPGRPRCRTAVPATMPPWSPRRPSAAWSCCPRPPRAMPGESSSWAGSAPRSESRSRPRDGSGTG